MQNNYFYTQTFEFTGKYYKTKIKKKHNKEYINKNY